MCCSTKTQNTKKNKYKNKNLAMAAQKCMISMIGAMDRLWFHQIILFSDPSSLRAAEDAQKPSQSLPNSSNHSSKTQQLSPLAPPRDEVSSQESDDETETETERPTRLSLVSTKDRSHSSSPISAQKRSRNHGYRSLQKSMSCKRLVDLELEEVKGFMDLGFLFRKENLTKRIINLVPGLQRIRYDEDDDGEERKKIIRPYLSEAWIIRRPDSPLLNLRIPRASTAADMKKHLKFWALTVASAIQQES